VLSIFFQNLESLVQMPVGCGEQNMVLFTPNVYVMKYLSKTSQLDPAVKERLLRNMKTGKTC
jgi:alpha-2-macroglobulin